MPPRAAPRGQANQANQADQRQPLTEGQALALLGLGTVAANPEVVARTRMAEVVRGLIGTPERPLLSKRLIVALKGGCVACPKDVAAVSSAMAAWSVTRRAWLQEVLERAREADGTIVVGNHSGLEYEILADLAGALLERAGQQQNTLTDFAKDPARVGAEMEIAKAQSALKGALKRDNLPTGPQNPKPQDTQGNQNRNRRREGCYNCGDPNHIRKNCPKPDKRQRREAPHPPQPAPSKKGPTG